jgi:ATP-dependent Zn protease
VTEDLKALEAIAYHEAGHAATAYLIGMPIHSVTILPTEEASGHCLVDMPDDTSSNPSALSDLAIISTAGPLAQERFTGQPCTGGDDWQMLDAAMYLRCRALREEDTAEDDHAQRRRYKSQAESLARAYLGNWKVWAAVAALAALLLERRTIGGEEVERLLGGMVRRLRDPAKVEAEAVTP